MAFHAPLYFLCLRAVLPATATSSATSTTYDAESALTTTTKELLDDRSLTFLPLFGACFILVYLFAHAVELSKRLRPELYRADYHDHSAGSILHCSFPIVAVLYYMILNGASIYLLITAAVEGDVSCEGGLRWEYHAIVVSLIVLGCLIELGYYQQSSCKRFGFYKVAVKFTLTILARFDLWTDLAFPFVAGSCGEIGRPYAIVSSVFLVVGVFFCQHFINIGVACGSLISDGPMRCGKSNVAASITSKLANMELLVGLARPASSFPEEQEILYMKLCTTCSRCCFEDLVQAIIQLHFLRTSNFVNNQVLISIAIGLSLSVFGLSMEIFTHRHVLCPMCFDEPEIAKHRPTLDKVSEEKLREAMDKGDRDREGIRLGRLSE